MPSKLDFYREMLRIRRTEERIAKLYPTDVIKSPIHLAIGQEAISVAVCQALRPQDKIFMTYRSHAAYLAKGGSMRALFAEMYGKSTGCCKGKGGSMHLVDLKHGVLGGSSIVGTVIPNAVGYAYAMKYQNRDIITAVFFGDGATDEGVFYESLNFAALKSLPVIFICENNELAIHTRQAARQAVPDIRNKAWSLGVHGINLKSTDYLGVYESVCHYSDRLLPCLLEIETFRWREHVGPNEDFNFGYRTKDEMTWWEKNDPIAVLGAAMDQAEVQTITQAIDDEIDDAVKFAESSPFPEVEELYEDVYA